MTSREVRRGLVCAAIALLVPVAVSRAATVWQSDFNGTTDGVADLFNNNPEKVMIGPVNAGKLQITTQDPSGAGAFTPDKAGRATGSTLGAANSFSALYRFSWSQFSQTAAQSAELVGFLGNASPQTRQVLGVIMRHWHPTATDYYTAVDLAFGSVGITSFGYQAGPSTFLGTTNPQSGTPYQLAIGYDGTTQTLTADLVDGAGNLIVEHSSPLTGLGMTPAGSAPAEIAAMALNTVGWSDYSYNLTDLQTIWQTDSLTYYNTAGEAKAAALAVPEPAALAVMTLLAVPGLMRRRNRPSVR